jgi:4-diphosphocytidyl-2-C-methyl-D-erythritol kinase
VKVYRADCPAKLNLFLEVLGRRPDGYHELATVMAPVDLCDTLEVRPARRFSLEVEGSELPGVNTVEKAWRAAARQCRVPAVRVRLVKRIPAGSGTGGGSSDAAAMIEALDLLFDLGLDRAAAAAEVGSDVAFFLGGGPALCTGRGELVAPLGRAPRLHAVLVWPGFPLSTAEVYRRVRQFLTRPRRDVIDFLNRFGRGRPEDLGRALFNRLEAAAFDLRPDLAALRRRLARRGFLGTRMTGSGSALFGLCASRAEAARLAKRIRGDEPGAAVWAVSGVAREGPPWRSRKSESSWSAPGATSSGPSAPSPSTTRS